MCSYSNLFLSAFTKCMHDIRKKTFQTPVQLHEDPEVFGSVWYFGFEMHHMFMCFYPYTFAHLWWTIPGPASWYISWVIHWCWKVYRDPMIEPPIQDKYLRSGGASIFTLVDLGTKARNSSSSLSANSVKVEKYDTEFLSLFMLV